MKDKQTTDSASSDPDAEFWQNPPIHPEAQKLPKMSDADLDELRRDIFENGLREPIDIFVDNREEANGAKGPFPKSLMDGRNRWEAIKRLGYKSPLEVSKHGVRYHYAIKWDRKRKRWVQDCDPVKFILSKNVYRRHLTPEHKRQAIAYYIQADPTASDSKIAQDLNVSPNTVKNTRKKSDQNLQNAKNDHKPIERARAAIRENPDASIREIAKLAGVGFGVAQKAKRETAPQAKTEPSAKQEAAKEFASDADETPEPESTEADTKKDEPAAVEPEDSLSQIADSAGKLLRLCRESESVREKLKDFAVAGELLGISSSLDGILIDLAD